MKKYNDWTNGDDCNYGGRVWQFVSVLSDKFHGTAVIFDPSTEELKQVPLSSLSKPETQEAKAKREALELLRDGDPHNVYDFIEILSNAGMLKSEEVNCE